MMSLTQLSNCLTLEGSFSSVSTATIARKDAFCSIFLDLQDLHSFAPLEIRREKTHWGKTSRNQAKRKCEKTETTRPQQKMIEKGETNWDAIRRNYQYHPHWNAGNSATAGREAAAIINYWCRVAFTSTAHAFSKKTHGHPLEQYRDCRNTDEQAWQQDDKMDDRRELPDEATTHAHPST